MEITNEIRNLTKALLRMHKAVIPEKVEKFKDDFTNLNPEDFDNEMKEQVLSIISALERIISNQDKLIEELISEDSPD